MGTDKRITISNAQKRLEKAYELINDVFNRLAPEHYDEMYESLGSALDFCTNAIGHCKSIRGVPDE